MKAGILIAVLVLALMFGGSAFAGDKPKPGDEPGKPKPGGGDKPKPGGGKRPGGKPKPDAPGMPDDVVIPDWFDADGNSFWVDPDCRFVLEGDAFEPLSKGRETRSNPDGSVNAASEPTLAETLSYRDGVIAVNSVYGFVDYLIDYEGMDNPDEIALRVLQEGNALCADIPAAQRSEGIRFWLADFSDRISQWVYESVGGIPFGGDA